MAGWQRGSIGPKFKALSGHGLWVAPLQILMVCWLCEFDRLFITAGDLSASWEFPLCNLAQECLGTVSSTISVAKAGKLGPVASKE